MRLIDADELKTAFPCGEYVRTESVRATIDSIPTIEAEPVVRCKDCTYNEGKINKKGYKVYSANGMDITDDDYCSWGERQTVFEKIITGLLEKILTGLKEAKEYEKENGAKMDLDEVNDGNKDNK